MRFSLVLPLLSAGIFGSAVVIRHQDAPLAEQQFKNIKTLKGAKASDIIPSMQFMSASLKVDCDFCHTEDRASDEKRPKESAREMIEMQRGINEKYFGGRNQITCATCHAGHTHPVSVPPVEGSDVRVRRGNDVEVANVIAAYAKASGSATAKSSVTDLALNGTTFARGEKSKIEATYSGEKFVFTVHGAKGDQKQGYNGTVIWFTTPRGVQAIPVGYAAQYVRQNTIFTGADSLPKLDASGGGTAKIGDKDMLVVYGTLPADKTRVTLYFDKKTGLLARTQFSVPTILGNILQTNDLSDYKRVGGVLIPMSITNHTSESDIVMHYTSAKITTPAAPATFDPPAK